MISHESVCLQAPRNIASLGHPSLPVNPPWVCTDRLSALENVAYSLKSFLQRNLEILGI